MHEIVALGELLVDMIEVEGNQYKAFVGGAPANVVAMAAKLGKDTSYIGKVGDDRFGKKAIDTLQEIGVNVDSIVISKNYPTTLAFVHKEEDSSRRYTFYRNRTADVMLAPHHVNDEVIKGAKIFHFGSLSLKDEPQRAATLLAVDYAKKHGAIISFDPNYRENLWEDKADAIKNIISVIPNVDILKCSEEELMLLTGEDDAVVGAKVLKELGPKLVIITLAERGAYYLSGDEEAFVEAPDYERVDVTGAGDAFVGTFLSCLLDNMEIKKAIRLATEAGSLAITKQGAIESLPTKEELKYF